MVSNNICIVETKQCENTVNNNVSHSQYPGLLLGCSLVNIMMAILGIIFTTLALDQGEDKTNFINISDNNQLLLKVLPMNILSSPQDYEVQTSLSGVTGSVLSLTCGVSGYLVSTRWWWSPHHHCVHLVISLVTVLGILVTLVMAAMDIVWHRMELKMVESAWMYLPYTVSYNEQAQTYLSSLFNQYCCFSRMELELEFTSYQQI